MSNAAKNIKVLLVEDHIMARMGTAIFIQNTEGLELIGQAEDGLQAVTMASELNPDVILIAETEIWPIFIYTAKKRNIKT